ncbi:MAG: glycerophosphodiester phosphodiesterase [bacterium]
MMQIYAHRGSSLIWPENTMLAFDLAHQAGATGFETDLRLSRDEHIILSHDGDLARFDQPEIKISETPLSGLTGKKITSIDRQHSDNLISLRMLLEKYPGKNYIFDCKISDQRLFERLQELLQDIKFQNRIWFLTWSAQADRLVSHFFPDCRFFPRAARTKIWGWSKIVKLGSLLEPANRVLALPAYYFGMPLFNKREVASVHQRGKIFVGYLVNSKRDYERCRACGVQTVLSDRPDLIAGLERDASKSAPAPAVSQ